MFLFSYHHFDSALDRVLPVGSSLPKSLTVSCRAVEDSIKDDTGAIRSTTQALRHDTAAIHVNTEEILAHVMSLRNGSRTEATRTRQWLESIAVLSSYAESSYQATIIDPNEERDGVASIPGVDEEPARGKDTALDTILESGRLEVSGGEERVRGTRGRR